MEIENDESQPWYFDAERRSGSFWDYPLPITHDAAFNSFEQAMDFLAFQVL